ncbi:MAG: bifunctional phosphoribosylaminoimidazolecarboxamide formyltransferase/IMP cyclohydrolase [Armatimonadota bacterium]|nr:bifunctional phosphoribosylaminoimidazolecarboxamide formyltransferase/IMP cyclohydrolase [Armatimonadota bacterium]MDW8142488.1 bifunctional phosphoribosylaminoimidazolecarboxamide formyltransferase/IMP cyclohydrolase [Armatimonadota bacterium]
MPKRALLSVWDKDGIVEFAKGLCDLGFELVSTGGTARALKDAGLPVLEVREVTQFPEILSGRVKTIHPFIAAGILALRDVPTHLRELEQFGISTIDLVAVNLYPFREVVRQGVDELTALEHIDIGGVTLLRAAAKNYRDVVVVCDPSDYQQVLKWLQDGEVPLKVRAELALKAFAHTAAYDAAILAYFSQQTGIKFPRELALGFVKRIELRYGENPHQQAAFYADPMSEIPSVATAVQLWGKELSFNNIADLDAALNLVLEFEQPAACIIKHTNPCGVAIGETLSEAFAKARDADPEARFGGIIGVNRKVDVATAEEILVQGSFYEAIIAPDYEPEALERIKARKGWGETIRILKLGTGDLGLGTGKGLLAAKSVTGGLLVQTADVEDVPPEQWQVVTERAPTESELKDLWFAWKVVKHVKSNAIVVAKNGATVGIGAGQMNRAFSVKIAVELAGEKAKGAVLASEAFFPMPDGPEIAAKAGVTAIVQPGGSKRDREVIEVCNRYGVAMAFTGMRHFRH